MAPKFISKYALISMALMICLAAIPAPALAASLPSESVVVQTHTIKFYLDPALVSDMEFAKSVLVKYVDDMNFILSKNTSRQLAFDPETGILLSASQPHSNQAVSPLPANDFEIWAHAVHTDYAVSYGGYAGIDDSGAGVLAGLNWTRLYDPAALQPNEVSDYWAQINNMLHELAHVFGAGIGEYYKLATIEDATGAEPLLNINVFDVNDSFWSDKADFLPDPLLKNAAQSGWAGLSLNSRASLLEYVQYSKLTASIISGEYRNGLPLVDLSKINIKVVSAEDSTPIDAAEIKIWSVRGVSPFASQIISDNFTNASGETNFAWGGSDNPHNSYEFLRLIKVYKDGYQAEAKYVSIFDADIVKLVEGSNSLNVIIQLEKISASIPSESTFGDVSMDNYAWSSIEQLYNAKITGGCSVTPLLYCPDQVVTRGQMAIFLERSMRGSEFEPSAGQVSFEDTANHWASAWIEILASDGITSGCGNGNYCPDLPVTRGQMAIFLLRAKYGANYVPPAPSGNMFQDVPADYWAAAWIEQFSAEGITSGCGNGSYCPDMPVTRAQMAVFLAKSFKFQ